MKSTIARNIVVVVAVVAAVASLEDEEILLALLKSSFVDSEGLDFWGRRSWSLGGSAIGWVVFGVWSDWARNIPWVRNCKL